MYITFFQNFIIPFENSADQNQLASGEANPSGPGLYIHTMINDRISYDTMTGLTANQKFI